MPELTLLRLIFGLFGSISVPDSLNLRMMVKITEDKKKKGIM